MKNRCFWVTDSKLYQEYHDSEWGEPVYDDAVLFEFLLLETFQAGLNWLTNASSSNSILHAITAFATFRPTSCSL